MGDEFAVGTIHDSSVITILAADAWVIKLVDGVPVGVPKQVGSLITGYHSGEYMILAIPQEKFTVGQVIQHFDREKLGRLPLGSIIVDQANDVGRKTAHGWNMLDDGQHGVVAPPAIILRVGYDNYPVGTW